MVNCSLWGSDWEELLEELLAVRFPPDPLQELSKRIDKYVFLKVLGSPETLFQKGFWWGSRGLAPTINSNLNPKNKIENHSQFY